MNGFTWNLTKALASGDPINWHSLNGQQVLAYHEYMGFSILAGLWFYPEVGGEPYTAADLELQRRKPKNWFVPEEFGDAYETIYDLIHKAWYGHDSWTLYLKGSPYAFKASALPTGSYFIGVDSSGRKALMNIHEDTAGKRVVSPIKTGYGPEAVEVLRDFGLAMPGGWPCLSGRGG